jgi:hypothetical protein
MDLPRRERRTLHRIEADIIRSDPGLAWLLREFGQESLAPSALALEAGLSARAGPMAAVSSAACLLGRASRATVKAILVPGIREQLMPRLSPQPMARTPWQRLT